MTSVFYGHQRQCSGDEQLITPATVSHQESGNPSNSEPVYCNPTSSSASRCVELSLPARANQTNLEMRFSTLSDCSSYYGLPDSPNENQSRHILKDPNLRNNCGIVLGSLALTLFGTILISFGLFVTLIPNDLDVHGWLFLVVGVLFFIPGFYHLFYIASIVCGRAGYSFDNLPTFNRPN